MQCNYLSDNLNEIYSATDFEIFVCIVDAYIGNTVMIFIACHYLCYS